MERYAYNSSARGAVRATIQTQVDIDAPLSEQIKAANELVETSLSEYEKRATKRFRRDYVLHRLLSIVISKDKSFVTYTYGVEFKEHIS